MIPHSFPSQLSHPVHHSLNVHHLYKTATCRRPSANAAAALPLLPAAATGPAVRPISRQPSPLEPATGYVPREVDAAQVPGSFRQLLDSIVAAYQAACGTRLVGVYLRGSLPRGLFLPGISDVDTFAVVLRTSTATAGGSSNGDTNGSSISSTDSSLQDLQQAVQRLSAPAVQEHQHLGYTKVEVRVLQVASQTAAAALFVLLQQQHSPNTTQHTAAQHSSSKVFQLSPSVSAAVPYAFELKTASMCLAGLDLPRLLHPSAALPPQFEVLPGLAGSIEDAQAAVQAAAAAAAAAPGAPAGSEAAAAVAAAAHHMEVLVRATKWALKRLLRGAFELVQDRAGCYTRDLFWCCQEAKQHIPQLQQQLSQRPSTQQQQHQQEQQQQLQQDWQLQLDAALQLYVRLQTTLLQYQQQAGLRHAAAREHQQQQGAAQAGGVSPNAAAAAAAAAALEAQQQLQQLVDDSWQLVQVLLPKLETLFLKAMLFEEPGWLTQHAAHPIPACPTSSSSSGSDDLPWGQQQQQGKSKQQQQQQQHQQSTWLFAGKALQALQGVRGPALTAAAAEGGGNQRSRGSIMGAVPPAVQVPVLGHIQAFDWQQHEGRAAGAAAVCRILNPGSGSSPSSSINSNSLAAGQLSPPAAAAATNGTNDSNSSNSSSRLVQGPAGSELLGCLPQPVVLRGAAASWPCVTDGWDLAWLQEQQGMQGKVRVAPSLQFPFVEPQLLEILLRLKGTQAAPSILADMSAAEFVRRLQPGCRLPPLAYAPTKCYYWQADLPPQMNQQQQLDSLLKAFSKGCGSGQGQQQQEDIPPQECVTVTQQPRLWVSPAGAVSPLHYDKSTSFLVQVAGAKRMLFFSPDQLYRLYCYPDTHILRRRSRVNVSAPDLQKHPLFEGAAALEAVLQPGDVVCFPSFWAHYTESLGQGRRPPVAAPDGRLVDPVGCSMSVTFRCQASHGA